MDCREFIRLSKEWKKDVCIFGAGEFGSNDGYEILKEAGFHISFYCDNKKYGEYRNGLTVYSADHLEEFKNDILCIVAVYGVAGDEIVRQLNEMEVKNIYRLSEGSAYRELPQYLDELKNPDLIAMFPYIMDDKIVLERRFRMRIGKKPNFNKPRTFNEKIQWMKLYDRQPLYTLLADKYMVKKYVSEKIGAQYVIPTLGVWNSFDDIDFESLPNKFVLKCTHDSGSVVFCRDKKEFDYDFSKKRLETALQRNYFWLDREWSYYGIPKRIIAEEFIEPEDNKELPVDYKVHCFGGEPKYIQTITERNVLKHTAKQNIYDFNWGLLPWGFGEYPDYPDGFERPVCLDEMYRICRKLCEGLRYVRIDFYITDGQLKFGEFTFYPAGGYYVHNDYWSEEVDNMLGDEIII